MDLLEHGREKFPSAAVLTTSETLAWRGLAAEVRSHPSCELAPFTSSETEITIALRGRPGASVNRSAGGLRQQTPVRAGTIWITPGGSREEATRITGPLSDIAHIYLSNSLIESLKAQGESRGGVQAIGYVADARDDLIRQIGISLIGELRSPTAGGKILAESLGVSLAARILQRHSYGVGTAAAATVSQDGVDDLRMRRVVDYMMAHLEDPIGLDDLAEVACLSPFHFARTFRMKAGLPPHRFLSRLRLEHAKSLLARTDRSIGDIALACQFSSQSSFARAFREFAGLAPNEFRKFV